MASECKCDAQSVGLSYQQRMPPRPRVRYRALPLLPPSTPPPPEQFTTTTPARPRCTPYGSENTLPIQAQPRTGPQDPSNNHATIHTVQRAPPAEAHPNTSRTRLPSSASRCKKHTNHTVDMAASPNSEAITESIRRAARKQGTLGRPQLVVALAPETQDASATN